ncbi:nucleotidyltransferase family protein [Rhizobium leguminosarum]|uniref:nucleotidyltransferase family protein n=1 Tax=Rhizobium leguminosarum TaxID=384 RepID=UPI003D7D92EC
MEDEQVRQLHDIVLKSPMLSALLHDWDKVALPDSWLVAGAIAQTVWNRRFGFPPAHGINDIDIVYFDASDLSEDAEAEHAVRVRTAFSISLEELSVRTRGRSGGRFTSRRSFDGSRSGQTLVSWGGLRPDEENRSCFRVRHKFKLLTKWA